MERIASRYNNIILCSLLFLILLVSLSPWNEINSLQIKEPLQLRYNEINGSKSTTHQKYDISIHELATPQQCDKFVVQGNERSHLWISVIQSNS